MFIYNNYYPTFGKRGIPNSRKASTYFVIDDLHFHSMPAVTVQSNGRVEKHSDQELAIIGSLAVIKDAEINSFPLFPIFSQGSSDMTDFF